MNSPSFSTLLAILLTLGVIAFGIHYFRLRRTYYVGVSMWSRWLPVIATGIYLAVLAVNLVAEGAVDPSSLDLRAFLSVPELIVLFLVGPLFLTRLGNLLGLATLAYCMQRLVSASDPAMSSSLALYLITGSVAVVAVLSDRMPWLAPEPHPLAELLREALLISLTFGALAVVFSGIIKVHGFSRWLAGGFGLGLPASLVLLLLVGLFVGWLSVALGMTRNFMIPLLSLPTLFALAYVTGWPSCLLVVPFALCLALSLATAERRLQSRRRHAGFTTSFMFHR